MKIYVKAIESMKNVRTYKFEIFTTPPFAKMLRKNSKNLINMEQNYMKYKNRMVRKD